MKLRNVDRAYNWLRSQPRRPHHYRDDVWTALVALHPEEFEQTEERKTPWYSLHRDMSKDDRFVRGERGMFELAPDGLTERKNTATGREQAPEAREDHPAASTKTRMEQIQQWVLEALRSTGGTAKLSDLIVELETTRPLTVGDREPQAGHEKESTFAYRCRWAVTRLRKQGLLKNESPRGVVEIIDATAAAEDMTASKTETNAEPEARPAPAREPQVWLFQANPKYYRILEALQALERLTFLTNRYKDAIAVGDVVLLWMSGKHAGIYAQARVAEGIDLRGSDGPDASFWADPSAAEDVKPRVVLAIERRFLGNPVLKTRIASVPGLRDLMILRQPNGTNFRVTPDEWAALQPLLPERDSREPDQVVLSAAIRTARGGKLYERTCGELLEQYVAERFAPGHEHPRDAIVAWFKESYPLFKPITVQCHIEKYTTNFRSRVHYNAGPEHDLLYREGDDWSRLRLFKPGVDPEPVHQRDDERSGNGRSEAARKAWETRRKRGAGATGTLLDRHRRLLHHLATFGELTPIEEEQLGVSEQDVEAWLDSLLVVRPGTRVVSPLFLSLLEEDLSPVRFTTQIAVRLMGHHVERVVKQPLDSIEQYVWERFASWRLSQPHPGDEKWHGYLALPAREPADKAGSERLDLFSRLPSTIIGELVREPGFLTEQQQWSAQAAGKTNLGVLSRQLKLGVRRPLFLSHFRLPELSSEPLRVRELPLSEALARSHVVSGTPMCTPEEWTGEAVLGREGLTGRLLEHPLHALIVQLEAHRMMAGLSGQAASTLRVTTDGDCSVEVGGNDRGPLWKTCRTVLVDLGYWPAGASTADSFWSSAVQVALANLITAGVIEMAGGSYRLTEAFGSDLKAHPGHPQNRGEKPFRARLLQYIEGIQGGAR